MTRPDLRVVHPAPPEQKPAVPSEVLATLLFIGCETMLFGAFVSAHAIGRANVPEWPPLDQPRLPIEATAFNTLVLLSSGVLARLAGRATETPAAFRLLALSLATGAFFVLFQGVEWARLISEGLTLTRSTHASFFYLIVGAHAVHAAAGLAVLAWMVARLRRGALSADAFWAGRLYWYFVVGLWPILYWRVYL